MKKILSILVVLIGFGVSANAVNAPAIFTWDDYYGLKYEFGNAGFSNTGQFYCYNSNNYGIDVKVTITFVNEKGKKEVKTETFSLEKTMGSKLIHSELTIVPEKCSVSFSYVRKS